MLPSLFGGIGFFDLPVRSGSKAGLESKMFMTLTKPLLRRSLKCFLQMALTAFESLICSHHILDSLLGWGVGCFGHGWLGVISVREKQVIDPLNHSSFALCFSLLKHQHTGGNRQEQPPGGVLSLIALMKPTKDLASLHVGRC